MKKWLPYFLPALLVLAFALSQMGILHVSFLKIKSHELRLTELSYNFIPGGIYTGGETVTNNNYEDALIGILPDYKKALQKDLDLITQNREGLDRIDNEELYIYSNKYKLKVCIEHKRTTIVDSSLFKRIAYLDILGQYELWNKDGTQLLETQPSKKWWIRDSVIFKGIASPEFYENKLSEIWLAQLTETASEFVSNYASVSESKRWVALSLYFDLFEGKVSSNYRMDDNDLRRGIRRMMEEKNSLSGNKDMAVEAKAQE